MYPMKNLKVLLLLALFSVTQAMCAEVECESSAIQVPAKELLRTMKAVSEGMYKDIATMKVNMDGEGKLSVYYEKGEPKLIKFTYTNGKGTVVIQKSFEELEKGIPLIYENSERPGKAIVFEKGDVFKRDKSFGFRLKVRSSVDPERHQTFPIDFDPEMSAPKLTTGQRQFRSIVLSPGISMLSWDGTFKRVEFKN